MKKKWIKDLGENEVIHVPEKWMAETMGKVLRDMGMQWSTSSWDCFRYDTCYSPYSEAFHSVDFYRSRDYTIYSFHDLLDFQGMNMEPIERLMNETTEKLKKLLVYRPTLDEDEINRLRDEHEEMKEMLAEINECRTSFDRWGDIEYLLNKIKQTNE